MGRGSKCKLSCPALCALKELKATKPWEKVKARVESLLPEGVHLPDIGISEFVAKLPTIEEIQARMLSVEDLRLILPSKENLQALRENIKSNVKTMVEHVKET